jgi:predicted Rossmann fold flavoprotein
MIKKAVKKTVLKKAQTNFDVVIIGGGPAGLMAAISASDSGAKVLVLEKNTELGQKLLISGGGRCNITNADPDHRNFVSKYGRKGNYLFSPFSVFGVPETIKFFNDLGLKTKIEAGYRVFPESDNSADVLNILIKKAKENGVDFKIGVAVVKLEKIKDKMITAVLANGEKIKAKNFILTTGGLSRPETGSTGDGFIWLKELGHKIVKPNPSLVPIKISNSWIADLSGISLDQVGISVWVSESGSYKKKLSKKGRILFTHTGLSGPTILNMSKEIGELLPYGEVLISLDFFPGVGLDEMHEMMKNIFAEHINKKIKNLIFKEIPAKIFDLMLKQLEIDPEWEINEIRREERFALIEKFKKFELTAVGLLGFDRAIISSGGLDLSEVDFKTMKSKKVTNLFVAGDILDFDRPTGGYSLQLCWTTGYLAGQGAK